MEKYLFIAEKPSLMRAVKDTYKKNKSAINKAVGEIDFIALSGHVCGLCLPNEYEDWDCKWQDIDLPMIPTTFKIKPNEDKMKIISDIKLKLKLGFDGIIVGTDADVEGNGIYYLLEQHLHLGKYKALRFFENDLTEKAILDSLLSMTDFHTDPFNVHMTEAFLTRSHFDWLVGMNFTTGFTVKSGFKMRVGRVKAPTLKMVYDNSIAIDNFVPHTDFALTAHYKEGFDGIYVGDDEKEIRFETKEDAVKFHSKLGKTGTIRSVKSRTIKSNAPQLYKLSDVQVDAGKQFGYSPTQTKDLVQSLYERHKIVSYPRTDGRYISTEKAKELPLLLKCVEAIPELSSFASRVTAADITKVKSDKRVVNDVEVKKSSHDALLPTGTIPDLTKLSPDELNICTLIYKRLLALFLPPLVEEKTILLVEISDSNGSKAEALFKTNGKVTVSKGFTELYKKKTVDTSLPYFKKGDSLTVDKFETVDRTTTPPVRLTQVTLISAMEDIAKYIEDKDLKEVMKDAKGIGMPSSRDKIIEDLLTTGYMEEKGKGLYITATGKTYIENLNDFTIVKPELTAVWETKMQKIKEGTTSYSEVETEMYDYIKSMVIEIAKARIVKSVSPENKFSTGYTCPVCKKQPLMISKYGWYCAGKKDKLCTFSVQPEIAKKKITDTHIKQLVEKGVTKEISGFQSRTGNKFSAKLKLNGDKVDLLFETESKETKKTYQCPCCSANVISDKWAWKCEKDCGFSLSYKVAGRTMKETDLKDLISKKSTKKLSGFVSKAGKPFSASLVLETDGKTTFSFI